MVRVLTSITFVYEPQEDRVAAAINPDHSDAWSCWLTRRLALVVLERTREYLTSTSNLAQRATADLRGEFIAFERDAAIANTAGAMTNTPPDFLKSSTIAAELAERLAISPEGDGFRLELRGQTGGGRQEFSRGPNFSAFCRCWVWSPRPVGWLRQPSLKLPLPLPQLIRSRFATKRLCPVRRSAKMMMASHAGVS
jgi:hypothetical protein